jgi:hypothetical protein
VRDQQDIKNEGYFKKKGGQQCWSILLDKENFSTYKCTLVQSCKITNGGFILNQEIYGYSSNRKIIQFATLRWGKLAH